MNAPAKRNEESRPDGLRPGLLLAVVAFLGVGLLAAVHELTKQRIAEQEAAALRARLGEVLDPRRHDNDLVSTMLTVTAPDRLGHDRPVRVFLARLAGRPAAVVVETIAPDGYNGAIELLVGVDLAGVVTCGLFALRPADVVLMATESGIETIA